MKAWKKTSMIVATAAAALVLTAGPAHASGSTNTVDLNAKGTGRVTFGNGCIARETHEGVLRADTGRTFGRYRINVCGFDAVEGATGQTTVETRGTFTLSTPGGDLSGTVSGGVWASDSAPNTMNYEETLVVTNGVRAMHGVRGTIGVHGSEVIGRYGHLVDTATAVATLAS